MFNMDFSEEIRGLLQERDLIEQRIRILQCQLESKRRIMAADSRLGLVLAMVNPDLQKSIRAVDFYVSSIDNENRRLPFYKKTLLELENTSQNVDLPVEMRVDVEDSILKFRETIEQIENNQKGRPAEDLETYNITIWTDPGCFIKFETTSAGTIFGIEYRDGRCACPGELFRFLESILLYRDKFNVLAASMLPFQN